MIDRWAGGAEGHANQSPYRPDVVSLKSIPNPSLIARKKTRTCLKGDPKIDLAVSTIGLRWSEVANVDLGSSKILGSLSSLWAQSLTTNRLS
jgi:hypothetical protein